MTKTESKLNLTSAKLHTHLAMILKFTCIESGLFYVIDVILITGALLKTRSKSTFNNSKNVGEFSLLIAENRTCQRKNEEKTIFSEVDYNKYSASLESGYK